MIKLSKLLAISLVVYAASITFLFSSNCMSMELEANSTGKAKLITSAKPSQEPTEDNPKGYIDDSTHIKNLATVCAVGSCIECSTIYGRGDCCERENGGPYGPLFTLICVPFQAPCFCCCAAILCCEVDKTPPVIRKQIHTTIRCDSDLTIYGVMHHACSRNCHGPLASMETKETIRKNIQQEEQAIALFKEWQVARQVTMQ